MGITTQTLMKEKFALQKTFNELNNRIRGIEKDLLGMKANLSAIHGALQEVEKLIQYDDNYGKKEQDIIHSKTTNTQVVDGETEKTTLALEPGPVDKPSLDIKPKEEPQQLNESDKWKKIGIAF